MFTFLVLLSAIQLHYIQEKADISTGDISKTRHLSPKQFKWLMDITNIIMHSEGAYPV